MERIRMEKLKWKEVKCSRATSFTGSGVYRYAGELAIKYNLSINTKAKIVGALVNNLERISYIESTINYVASILTSNGNSGFEIDKVIYTLLSDNACPTVSEIESLLSICLNEGKDVYEVLSTPRLYSSNITPELLYAELQLMEKGRENVRLKKLLKLNSKLNDSQKDGIQEMYPLSNKTKFLAYTGLKAKEKNMQANVKVKTHSL